MEIERTGTSSGFSETGPFVDETGCLGALCSALRPAPPLRLRGRRLSPSSEVTLPLPYSVRPSDLLTLTGRGRGHILQVISDWLPSPRGGRWGRREGAAHGVGCPSRRRAAGGCPGSPRGPALPRPATPRGWSQFQSLSLRSGLTGRAYPCR